MQPQEVDELLKKYVRPDLPFGPPDASDILEPQCSAALYDWKNRAFKDLLDGSDVLVGRRGSGKSSLMRSFLARQYIATEFTSDEARDFRERYHISQRVLTKAPDLVVEVNTAENVYDLEEDCARRTVIPPVEIMASLWRQRMWWLLGKEIVRHDGSLWRKVPDQLKQYIQFTTDRIHRPAVNPEISSDQFVSLMEAFLLANDMRVVVTFDNVEQLKFQPTQNAVLGGLIALTGKFTGTQHPSVDVKLCLPAEHFRAIRRITFRPDKDLHKVQYLHWNAAELLHLAARRLRVYLRLWDPSEYTLIRDKPISDRASLLAFWRRYLPPTIKNSVDREEDTVTYILRHTQMLPRHLISILNAICARTKRPPAELFSSKFEPAAIVKGVQDTEIACRDTVLMMFRPMYPVVDNVLDALLPRLPREIAYGELQKLWRYAARDSLKSMGKPDFGDFLQLMLNTGILGQKSDETISDIYSTALFEYNTKLEIMIDEKDTLCVHPIFSRRSNVKNDSLPLILPRGSNYIEEKEDI
jgi:hypothetical protein